MRRQELPGRERLFAPRSRRPGNREHVPGGSGRHSWFPAKPTPAACGMGWWLQLLLSQQPSPALPEDELLRSLVTPSRLIARVTSPVLRHISGNHRYTEAMRSNTFPRVSSFFFFSFSGT